MTYNLLCLHLGLVGLFRLSSFKISFKGFESNVIEQNWVFSSCRRDMMCSWSVFYLFLSLGKHRE